MLRHLTFRILLSVFRLGYRVIRRFYGILATGEINIVLQRYLYAMAYGKFEINADSADDLKKTKKFHWYWAPVYCVLWFLLFYVAVIPSFYSYPETLLIRDEHNYPDRFIGERAQIQLLGLAGIGVKVAGSIENEVHARNFLLNEIEKIKAAARSDLYDIDVQVQYSSGQFYVWSLVTSYKNVSNIIVRISPKNVQSQTYLLLNSHFDSEMGSPGAADAGIMIVNMLETLRVISRSERKLQNPIVFLLNGAEESNLVASHGFVTQHEWAPLCKAVINLDSAGSGGREVLFQSGPDHPWLMKYYKQSVPHPYAQTLAEELFQNNFIPSDTDFRIFRDFGHIPGLDMAHTLNGYVYHTKYDTFSNLERGTYQSTGDNILALAWSIANADELRNTTAYSEGHTVYYDYLGWFMISYTESTGTAINIVTSVCSLLAIAISIYLMTKRKTSDSAKDVYIRFLLIFGVQILTVAAAMGLTILIAVIVDALGISQSWYSNEWLIFGLYYCPIFFVLGLFQALFIHWTRKNSMELNDTIICFLHSHCIILAFLCLLMTGLSIRSAYLPMVAVFFYAASVVLNLMVEFFTKKNSYHLIIHLICQLFPFWFYTFLAFSSLKTFVPMQGRDGPTSQPELFVSIATAFFSLHYAGFIIPILHKFRKSKIFFSVFAVLTVIFIIIAATPAGFPYKKDVAAQRYYVVHTDRIIRHEFGMRNESGILVIPQDTRPNTLKATTLANAIPEWAEKECTTELSCGLPLYRRGWVNYKDYMYWLPANSPNLAIPTELQLTNQHYFDDNKVRYNITVHGVDRLFITVDPLPNVKLLDWSFDRTPIEKNYKTPYYTYNIQSMLTAPLEFWLIVERDPLTVKGPSIRLAVGAHYRYHTYLYTKEYKDFLKTFPDWANAEHWFGAFESWVF